ncbi:EAL domain-containing protein [Undibacterium sp. SXout7W]|uniref:sensor domain-containing protein n=1 Tax=Undibacterium sp. SXout7W TaxID=3413049 RepID=UPI003BF3CD8E
MLNRVLIVTNVTADMQQLEYTLLHAGDSHFEIMKATQLSFALNCLQFKSIDVILLDLLLPDSQGIGSLLHLLQFAPLIPIFVIADSYAQITSEQVIEHGAAGYLTRAYFSTYLIPQSIRNIVQRNSAENNIFIEKNRAEIMLNSISDAVIATDLKGNVNYLNDAATRLTQWTKLGACGHAITEVMPIINAETRKPVINPANAVLIDNVPLTLAPGAILVRPDGSELDIEDSTSPIHDNRGDLVGAVMVFHDVTAAQAMSAKMAYFAQHDFLTNLPNRILLNDRISQAISLANRRGTHLALLFLDLDNFKYINDSLGHAVGDLLLQSVAERLCSCVRHSDTVSRQGGDEFVILINEENSGDDASLIATKILKIFSISQVVGKHALHVTTSIGISIFPNDGENAEELIKNADTAMYQAKERGRNNYQFFKKEMNIRAVERQLIESHLRIALEKQEFTLFYQAKINLQSSAITGAEALLRWHHPVWGLVMPSRFIEIAEESGLIIEIGRWVLREACMQMKNWINAGMMLGTVAVNISALEFRRDDFIQSVTKILKDSDLEGTYLQLEITESVLMRDADMSTTILRQLKAMGIQIAVDDFGTGYSSLSYLKKFPIDILKIDQTFVRDIDSPEDHGAIVSAIVAMGNSLHFRVVAEGVEEKVQLDFLKKLDCEEAQGYIFGGPMIATDFTQFFGINGIVTCPEAPHCFKHSSTSQIF